MKCIKKILRKCLSVLINILWGVPLALMCLSRKFISKERHEFLVNRFAVHFAKLFSKFSKYYCMIEFLPKEAKDITARNLLTDTKQNEYAVVIQGPVLNGFTAESIRIYRKILPKAVIIVSTWTGTDKKLLEELQGLADEVILNEPPKTSGIMNINYQAKSSYAGMKKACELGIPYAFKVRSDLRIYLPLAFEYLKTLLELFPLEKSCQHLQKERIIASSGSRLDYPYWLQDHFYFGTSHDLLNFFDFPPDTRNFNGQTGSWGQLRLSNKKWAKRLDCPPEIALTKSYVKRFSSGKCESTVKNFWEDIRRRFLIISRSDIGMYWDKYSHTLLNFWNIAKAPIYERESFDTQLSLSLLKGHLLYCSELEEFAKDRVEVFENLGTFCSGYELRDEVLKDFPMLRGEE